MGLLQGIYGIKLTTTYKTLLQTYHYTCLPGNVVPSYLHTLLFFPLENGEIFESSDLVCLFELRKMQ